MKCRAMSTVYKNQPNSGQRRALKKQCEEDFFKLLEGYNRQVALQIMHILHFNFGFGEKRLKRFFQKLKEMQAFNIERYEITDEEVPDICEIQLRGAGIRFEDYFEME